jgi:ketosteroid isomerase-like protein
MDRSAVAQVRRLYESDNFTAGLPGVLALAHPDIELAPAAAWGDMQGSYHGHDGVREYFATLEKVFGRLQYDLIELTVHGEALLAEVLVHAEATEGGAGTSSGFYQALWFEDGKLRRVQGFLDRAAALAAVS